MATQLVRLINQKTKIPLGLFILVWVLVIYMLPQKLPIFAAKPVPITWVDYAIPLNPSWIWVYISYYLYLIVAFIIAKQNNANQIFYSYLVSAVIGTIIFYIIPTSIDRGLYPLVDTETLSGWMLALIRRTDESLNCAPSMHIAMTTMACGTYLREKNWFRIPAVIWALGIAYSTMATKQHYWWDVITGFVFGLFIFAFFDRATYVQSARLPSPLSSRLRE